jgi:hypothetical protein
VKEKKERQDKERTQRIREAESSGVKSEKVREMEKVKEQLAQRGLNVHEVSDSGLTSTNICLFIFVYSKFGRVT